MGRVSAELPWSRPGQPSPIFCRELFHRELLHYSWKILSCGRSQSSSKTLTFPRLPHTSRELITARSQRSSNSPGSWSPSGNTRPQANYRRRSLPRQFHSQGPRSWASLRCSSLSQHPRLDLYLDLSLVLCQGQRLSPCLHWSPCWNPVRHLGSR